MAIPDYETVMLPLLKALSDREEHSAWRTIDELASQFNLTAAERKELLPSGLQEIFYNRVGWARTYLKKAGLVVSAKRGYWCITERGLDVIRQNPPKIDVQFLLQFEEFREFKNYKKEKPISEIEAEGSDKRTPEEALELAYQNLREGLANDLLQQIKMGSPSLFEKIVVELLVAMGYGGSREDAGRAVGKAGDEGIDGIIKEDRLGLDTIYIQAKRWGGIVGRPEIQKFAGALQGQHAKKGIFITTSDFTKDAYEYASLLSISGMGHISSRTLWHNQVALANSLRPWL